MSVWSPPHDRPGGTIHIANRPVVHAIFGAFGLLLGFLPLLAPVVPIVGKLALLAGFGGTSLVVLVLARRRWTNLTVGERIAWSRPGTRFELERGAARRVVIARTRWPLKDPTDYALEVEIKGRTVKLLFAEHWLWGGLARRHADRLAERLGVEVFDPVGERYRGSLSPFRRWIGAGQEWALLLFVIVFGAVPVVLLALAGLVGAFVG